MRAIVDHLLDLEQYEKVHIKKRWLSDSKLYAETRVFKPVEQFKCNDWVSQRLVVKQTDTNDFTLSVAEFDGTNRMINFNRYIDLADWEVIDRL